MAPPPLSVALQYIQVVQTKHRDSYDAFRRALKEYRNRAIDPSELVSIVRNLFRNHDDLLDGFKAFVPPKLSAAVAAPTAKESDLTASVDFLNRVRIRLRGGRLYPKFLNCMCAYSRKEMSDSDVRDKVVGLLGENDDLVDEFMGFLPKSMRKRKVDQIDQTDLDLEFGLRKKRRRGSPPDSRDSSFVYYYSNPDDRETRFARRRRTPPRVVRKITSKEDRENEMEDSLCRVDVRIGNLESLKSSALRLFYLISAGGVSAENFRLDDHFTTLNLACIDEHFTPLNLADDYMNLSSALPELLQSLTKEKEIMEKERIKIVENWKKIRRS